jgi:peptidoglycan/xylan/chitin deacetylase (PgdA/CDA1 family)
MNDIYVLLTMDCESAKVDVTPYAMTMSGSGPAEYGESERSIRGYVQSGEAFGFPTTLFVHPEVAQGNRDCLLELQEQGVCLGLHLHPYKFGDGRHEFDLGAYSASKQREILCEAIEVWEKALGQRPVYYRGGYFSANDNTFQVLHDLGFKGGSMSNPGRALPGHCSVWAGAEPYPHRAHFGFRHLAGSGDFVEVPVAVAFDRPTQHPDKPGYEWPYVPSSYDHVEVLKGILKRFKSDDPSFGTIVTDTHNDMDYSNPDHFASRNYDGILNSIVSLCEDLEMRPVGVTLASLCDRVTAE